MATKLIKGGKMIVKRRTEYLTANYDEMIDEAQTLIKTIQGAQKVLESQGVDYIDHVQRITKRDISRDIARIQQTYIQAMEDCTMVYAVLPRGKTDG